MYIDNRARRIMLAVMAAMPFGEAAASPAASTSGTATANSRTLVAYFSRSGNTRVIAGVIQRAQQADLLEILPAHAYPDDYFETVEQARQERERGEQPVLANLFVNLAAYDTVFLGFPVWGETVPPVIRSFLLLHDMSGKVLQPFITHGGYGAGNSAAELAKRAKGARLQEAFVMECDQERRTTTQVQDWLGTIKGRGV